MVPPSTDATNQYQAGIVIAVRCGLDVDLQSIFGQSFGQPHAPFNESDRVGCVRVQIKIIQFGCVGQPVGVDMDQVRLTRL